MSAPSSPSETRPADRRRIKVRGAILEAAERVFAEEGEDGLSIRRLADEIDYSPAAIYKYFASKQELVNELKDAFFEQILTQVDNVYQSAPDVRSRGRACLAVYVHTAIARPHHYMAAFAGIRDIEQTGAPDAAPFENSIKHRAFMILQTMVEDGIACGVMREEIEPALAARSLWASCHGLAMLMTHLPGFPAFDPLEDTMDRNAFIALHADQLMRGLERSQPVGDV